MTDAELVHRTRNGESLARDQLVRRWAPRVLAICRAKIGHHHVAEDLAQETLIRGLADLSRLEQAEKFGGWLRSIAGHVCTDWQRSCAAKRRAIIGVQANGQHRGQSLSGRDSSPANQAEDDEQRERLEEAIDQLSEDLREPLMLFYYDEMTYEEIAALVGVSRATVNTRLTKARHQLACQLASLVELKE
ncbi:ECF RNA polymerase sigma factor SigE [Thalassoglobus neptunius]|uniref:ECF RNA polymerase sigma factor SigE n=1 Tax=Thalassoglobus neptunius TaxID=1938619 RepID=A0A5C5X838_9PLAN|nr:sigma-70 family RNA polymerase sigma factor [Thalassoglobus neptunius]TWT58295.1 ECF RNA polymerase sigma factor SigE [Thalassoglobus neptunius]